MGTVLFLTLVVISGGYLIAVFRGIKDRKQRAFIKEISEGQKICIESSLVLSKEQSRNRELEQAFSSTIALYDFTKEINRTFLPDEIKSLFKDVLGQNIKYEECLFVPAGEKGSVDQDGYFGFDLELGSGHKERLLVKGLSSNDWYVCNILVNQLIMGLRRAYLYAEIQRLAISDSLTGVFSRRHAMERLAEELERSDKLRLEFSLLMIDIDKFKEINDIYGHMVGDWVLCETVGMIKNSLRQIDLLGRYGGEEFVVLLSETGEEKAVSVAERIRLAVETHRFRAYDEDLKVTVSIGVGTFSGGAVNALKLLENADSALYAAKEKGRNRVCAYKKQNKS